MNINLATLADDIAAHKAIMQRAYPEVTFFITPVLLPAMDNEASMAYEVWWPATGTDGPVFMHVTAEGTTITTDELPPAPAWHP